MADDKTKERPTAARPIAAAAGDPITRDTDDLGVPMLEGAAGEPVGPEDALGSGIKRGDYTDRQDGAQHYESVAAEDGGEWNEDGTDRNPFYTHENQNARLADIGDTEGKKGGVTSTPTVPPVGP